MKENSKGIITGKSLKINTLKDSSNSKKEKMNNNNNNKANDFSIESNIKNYRTYNNSNKSYIQLAENNFPESRKKPNTLGNDISISKDTQRRRLQRGYSSERHLKMKCKGLLFKVH